MVTSSSSSSRSVKTIEVYVSYCPLPVADSPFRLDTNSSATSNALGTNTTDPSTASGSDSGSNSTISAQLGADNALCNTCPNSVGICCPPTVECDDSDGKCPQYALELSHNTINGYLIAQVMNSTAPVSGRRKLRALVRSRHDEAELREAREKASHGDVLAMVKTHKKGRAYKKQF